MLRWIVAAIHLFGLGLGLGAVWARGRVLRGELDTAGLRRAFYADSWWGAAAGVWIATGVLRAFAGLEKGSAYYLHNHLFWAKMGLLMVILLLEIGPMVTLIRWRRALTSGRPVDTHLAPRLARISFLQAGVILLMVLAATGMARGYGAAAP